MNEIESLLQETSRTFALSIPFLQNPLRRRVGVAYLLFRIADTVEDEPGIDPELRDDLLCLMAEAASDPDRLGPLLGTIGDQVEGMISHDGYARLMRRGTAVLAEFCDLDAEARKRIAFHLARTCRGMREHLCSGDEPRGIESLRSYCYSVAGIVGELLTELFIQDSPRLESARSELAALAPSFGEALQLVNILRDERDDAIADRRYIPTDVSRAEISDLADRDLRDAGEYVALLESSGAPTGVVAFNAVNLRLAIDTLGATRSRGPGAKVGRSRVAELVEDVRRRAGNGSTQSAAIREALQTIGIPARSPVAAHSPSNSRCCASRSE